MEFAPLQSTRNESVTAHAPYIFMLTSAKSNAYFIMYAVLTYFKLRCFDLGFRTLEAQGPCGIASKEGALVSTVG